MSHSKQNKDNDWRQTCKWGIFAVFALSACSLVIFLWQIHEVHRAEKWSNVDAVVTTSLITWDQEIHEGRWGNRVVTIEHVFFSFDYVVSGQQYSSANFYWYGASPADLIRMNFPVGRHFTALYNPADPTKAAVQAGGATYGLLIGSIITFCIALVGLVQYVSMVKKNPDQAAPASKHHPKTRF